MQLLPEDSGRTAPCGRARHDAFSCCAEGVTAPAARDPCNHGFLGRAVHDQIGPVYNYLPAQDSERSFIICVPGALTSGGF